MAKNKTNNGEGKISFSELVESRKEEMQHILPGFMTEVTDGKHSAIVYSPTPNQRSHFSVKEQKA